MRNRKGWKRPAGVSLQTGVVWARASPAPSVSMANQEQDGYRDPRTERVKAELRIEENQIQDKHWCF